MRTSLQILLALLCFCARAQNAGSVFQFRFFDEQTGIRVIPYKVTVTNREHSKTSYTLAEQEIDDNGTAILAVKDGTYDITVAAREYEPMSTWFDMRQQTLNVKFRLVPFSKQMSLSVDHLQGLHRPDTMVLTGFVVDDSTGLPLKDVQVAPVSNVVRTRTDANGFFVLMLPTTNGLNEPKSMDTIQVSKSSYTTERYEPIRTHPQGDLILRPRLRPGTGTHVEQMKAWHLE